MMQIQNLETNNFKFSRQNINIFEDDMIIFYTF